MISHRVMVALWLWTLLPAAPARAAPAPAPASNTAATRSEVVPLHERASQNTFHEDDSGSDGGSFDAGGFDEPEPETPDPGGWTG